MAFALPSGRFAFAVRLVAEVGEVLARGEVLVGQARGAAEGAGLDQLDDGGDVAVEAAVAVDERRDFADQGVRGADGRGGEVGAAQVDGLGEG